jgi:hypothetical protein
MQALGIETRDELDGFLKARHVYIEYSIEELNREREIMEALMARELTKTA